MRGRECASGFAARAWASNRLKLRHLYPAISASRTGILGTVVAILFRNYGKTFSVYGAHIDLLALVGKAERLVRYARRSCGLLTKQTGCRVAQS